MDTAIFASLYDQDDNEEVTDLPPRVHNIWSAHKSGPGDLHWLATIQSLMFSSTTGRQPFYPVAAWIISHHKTQLLPGFPLLFFSALALVAARLSIFVNDPSGKCSFGNLPGLRVIGVFIFKVELLIQDGVNNV
ncbi:hypothetical protein C8R43DRAFT_962833 [Mycena crocata]|nr:hypothetical protein C8R43DRAFT_962833 [Mycena crocata]